MRRSSVPAGTTRHWGAIVNKTECAGGSENLGKGAEELRELGHRRGIAAGAEPV